MNKWITIPLLCLAALSASGQNIPGALPYKLPITVVTQKWFGYGPPTASLNYGDLPGDTYIDLTNNNEYWCAAQVAAFNAPPACTSVTTGGWTLVGSGSGNGGFIYIGPLSGIPASCSVGQVSFITDATAGQNQYNCTAANTWAQNIAGIGSVACGTAAVSGNAVAPVFSAGANCVEITLAASGTTTITPTIPVGAGAWKFILHNPTPVACADGVTNCPLAWAGITVNGQCQPDSSSAGAVTTITLTQTASAGVFDGDGCNSASSGLLVAGTIKASNGGAGPDVAATQSNLSAPGYVAGGGVAQAQTATLSPAIAAYGNGLLVCWKPTAANSGAAPTLAVNGLTATSITKLGNTALVANDIVTAAIACAIYNSSGPRFELQNPQTISATTTYTYGATMGLPSSGTAVANGTTNYFFVRQSCTVVGYNLAADQGAFTVKFWKIASGGTALPTVSNSISTSGLSLATGTKLDSNTTSDFTTLAFNAGDWGAVNVTATSGNPNWIDAFARCQ